VGVDAMTYEKPAWVFDETYGFLNENARRLAEVLADFDEHLRLTFIPERQRQAGDVKPYAIAYFHSPAQFEPSYFIMHMTETEINDPGKVLGQLFNMRNENIVTRLERAEAAENLIRMKKEIEAAEERKDVVKSMASTRKHRYKAKSGRVYNL
jgi:hypothetical protein